MKKYVAGIDVGGTTVKMGLFDEEGNLLEKWEIPTVTKEGSMAIFSNIAESLKEKMQKNHILPEAMAGAGLGVPAAVRQDGLMARAVNIGWEEMYPAKELENLLHIPVKAENDANVAAYGEMWKGAAKGHTNTVMVTLGTGVGGGIIVDGRILTGAAGGGGEIGHIHVEDAETEKCNCGQKGCLEQYASATGIVRLAKRRLAKSDAPSSLRNTEITAKAVFEAAAHKDGEAREIVEEFARYLGKGLGIVCSVVNPEVAVIGGGVSKAGEIIIKTMEPYFKESVFPACSHVRFVMAELGNDAGICGAAGMILGTGGNPCWEKQ